MAKIAHLKVVCPQCGKDTSIYVEEDGGSNAKVKCEPLSGDSDKAARVYKIGYVDTGGVYVEVDGSGGSGGACIRPVLWLKHE